MARLSTVVSSLEIAGVLLRSKKMLFRNGQLTTSDLPCQIILAAVAISVLVK